VPWRPLNPKADGFLSLLGLKNQGRNPETLNLQLQPTVDLLEWYFQSRLENITATRTVPDASTSVANFGATSLVVPDREWWWIENYTVRCVTALVATQVIDWQLGYLIPGAANHYVLKGDRSQHNGSAALTVNPWTHADGFFVPGGAQLVVMLNLFDVDAAGAALEAFVRIARLPN